MRVQTTHMQIISFLHFLVYSNTTAVKVYIFVSIFLQKHL